MKIFELHFNPKKKEGAIFDSFVFEPESASEKAAGNLYMVGEFAKILPQNSKFLNSLAQIIKEEYYSAGKLTEALKKANEFLDKQARTGNVNWLGNMHFGILSLASYKNAWAMNFSKAGEVKILLLRQGEISDVGQGLELKDIEPYPLKIFGNVITGKIYPGDKIILLTKDVFSLLSQKSNFLNQLKDMSQEKELKKLLKINKKLLSETAGICLLLILPDKKIAPLSADSPRMSAAKKPTIRLPGLKCPAFRCPFLGLLKKRGVKLVLILLIILIIGSFIFKSSQNGKEEETEVQINNQSELLQTAEDKINKARGFLEIMEEAEMATVLLEEAREIISGLEGEGAANLRKEIEELLNIINGG